MKKYFAVLGLQPGAARDEINRAYIELSRKFKTNKDKITEIEEAYAKLIDDENDGEPEPMDDSEGGPEGSAGPQGMEDLFEMLSGGRGRGRHSNKPTQLPKMETMRIALELTLDEVYAGEPKKLEVPRVRLCHVCGGKGCKQGGHISKCKKCGGRGEVMKHVQMGPGMYVQTRGKCDSCEGSGDILSEEDRCPDCKGAKREESKKEFIIKIDAGCPENHQYEFEGEGNQIVFSPLSNKI